jgi:hypothetical protein
MYSLGKKSMTYCKVKKEAQHNMYVLILVLDLKHHI